MRLIFPLILVFASMVWASYAYFIKKDAKLTKQIVSYTAFFAVMWVGLFFLIFYK
jgi:hypothetical protein